MPFAARSDGISISIRLRPGASANRIDGIGELADGGRQLCVRVTAAAEKGRANAAMIKLLAKAWRLPRGRLSVTAGAKDRNKTILLRDGDDDDLALLRAWAEAQPGGR